MSVLDAIRARAEAATKGPWRAIGTGVAGGDHWYVCDDGQSLASIASNDGENEDQRQPDAEFIAHARTDVPKLVAALEAVHAVHTPTDAMMYGGRNQRVVQVCTGCGTDDGNWQHYPCPTIRAITGAIK